jgi:hypothetical protein
MDFKPRFKAQEPLDIGFSQNLCAVTIQHNIFQDTAGQVAKLFL